MKKLLLFLLLAGCDDPIDVEVYEKNSAAFEARVNIKRADCGHCGGPGWCCNGVLEGKPVQYNCNETKCWWYFECTR